MHATIEMGPISDFLLCLMNTSKSQKYACHQWFREDSCICNDLCIFDANSKSCTPPLKRDRFLTLGFAYDSKMTPKWLQDGLQKTPPRCHFEDASK